MHGMFALVVSTLLLAFLVYAVFVLFWNKNEEENTDINNFIVDVGEGECIASSTKVSATVVIN